MLVEQFRRSRRPCTRPRRPRNTRRHGDQRRAGEGKSLTAVNLALTLSESYGRRVLLIDGICDGRRFTKSRDVPNTVG